MARRRLPTVFLRRVSGCGWGTSERFDEIVQTAASWDSSLEDGRGARRRGPRRYLSGHYGPAPVGSAPVRRHGHVAKASGTDAKLAPVVVLLTVRVKPRAKTTRIVRVEGRSLEVSLAAVPVDGAANDALIEMLAKALGVPRRSLRLAIGRTSKTKVVEVVGLDETEIAARLAT